MTKVHTVRLLYIYQYIQFEEPIQSEVQFNRCNSRIQLRYTNFCFLQLHPRLVKSVFTQTLQQGCCRRSATEPLQDRPCTLTLPCTSPPADNNIKFIWLNLHLIKEQKCMLLQQDNWWWFDSPGLSVGAHKSWADVSGPHCRHRNFLSCSWLQEPDRTWLEALLFCRWFWSMGSCPIWLRQVNAMRNLAREYKFSSVYWKFSTADSDDWRSWTYVWN
jgi:hypothetical protein